MRLSGSATLLLLLLTGCQWLDQLGPSPDVTPVMGAPPPRVDLANRRKSGGRPDDLLSDDPKGIARVSGSESTDPDTQFVGTQVVAEVNGSPILASDVLERYSGQLSSARKQATPAQMLTVRKQLIKRDLPTLVERRLLVAAMKQSIPKKQHDKLDEAIDNAFNKEIERLKKEFKVNTKRAVEQKLADQGLSLASLKDNFANQQMAAHYFQSKTKKEMVLGRNDLLDYYNKHLSDYAIPAQTRWQEIQISYDKNGGRKSALDVVQKAVDELKSGRDFGEVAKKYSDGTTAGEGGKWDWTKSGSLANERLDKALFELPVGQISQVMQDDHAYRLVKITERQKAGWVRFEVVQSKIREKLEAEAKRERAKEVMKELLAGATIFTAFDDDKDFQPKWRKDAIAQTAARKPVSP